MVGDAEIYASELGFEDTSGMQKYNFGEHLLKAALEKWIAAWAYSYVDSGSANGWVLLCSFSPLCTATDTSR